MALEIALSHVPDLHCYFGLPADKGDRGSALFKGQFAIMLVDLFLPQL